jgi:transaldolase
MRLFLDTANIDEFATARMGVLAGVTTNPSLMAKERYQYRERVIEICETVRVPLR